MSYIKVYFDQKSAYQVGSPQIMELVKTACFDLKLHFKSILRKDSLDFTDKDRHLIRTIVDRDSLQRIVITHGTDTMIETEKALRGFMEKTIVLTGAMQPAYFKESDAPYNIAAALMAVQLLPPGVYL